MTTATNKPKTRSPKQLAALAATNARRKGLKRGKKLTVGPAPIQPDEIARALLDLPCQKAAYLSAETAEPHATPSFDDPLFDKTPASPYEKDAWATYSQFRRNQKDLANHRLQIQVDELARKNHDKLLKASDATIPPGSNSPISPKSTQLGKDCLLNDLGSRPPMPLGADVQPEATRALQKNPPVGGCDKHMPPSQGMAKTSSKVYRTRHGEVEREDDGDGGKGRGYAGGSRDGGTIQDRGAGSSSSRGVGGRIRRPDRRLGVPESELTHPLAPPYLADSYGWRGRIRLCALAQAARLTMSSWATSTKMTRADLEALVATLPRRYPGRSAMARWLSVAPPSRWAFPRLDGVDEPCSWFTSVRRACRRLGWSPRQRWPTVPAARRADVS